MMQVRRIWLAFALDPRRAAGGSEEGETPSSPKCLPSFLEKPLPKLLCPRFWVNLFCPSKFLVGPLNSRKYHFDYQFKKLSISKVFM